MDKYKLQIIVQNKQVYGLTLTVKVCITLCSSTLKHVVIPLRKPHKYSLNKKNINFMFILVVYSYSINHTGTYHFLQLNKDI